MKNNFKIEIKIVDELSIRLIPIEILLSIVHIDRLLQRLMNKGIIKEKEIDNMTLKEIRNLFANEL